MIYGLAGRSGSGKGTAAKIFEKHGFFTVDCDGVARRVLDFDECVKTKLEQNFGGDLYADGKLDRKLLSKRAFLDNDSLQKLNEITHPAIISAIKDLIKGKEKILLDAPALFESGAHKMCDKIIGIVANDELCIERIVKRDGISTEDARRRLKLQISNEQIIKLSDIVIENLGNRLEFERQVEGVAKSLF